MILFPVVMPVIQTERRLRGGEKIDYLGRIAREALKVSAKKSGVTLGKLLKDENGAPCRVNGNYWSLSHKPEYVVAVVSKDKVGIDIEEVKPRDELLFARVASDKEWELKEKSWEAFFRYWTAKEAILKVIGIGISGLRTCRIISVPDENHISLDYNGQSFVVEQLRYKNHIVSVLKGDNQIDWIILEDFKP
ncbi:MAG: 4'-phosphopantetheinyl transferase superfamily protein [Chloroflexota bacterium]|nr:MAG: 4'-phosphopantetheinyl transferase superfamily protein [Chloroflexota bacterium]